MFYTIKSECTQNKCYLTAQLFCYPNKINMRNILSEMNFPINHPPPKKGISTEFTSLLTWQFHFIKSPEYKAVIFYSFLIFIMLKLNATTQFVLTFFSSLSLSFSIFKCKTATLYKFCQEYLGPSLDQSNKTPGPQHLNPSRSSCPGLVRCYNVCHLSQQLWSDLKHRIFREYFYLVPSCRKMRRRVFIPLNTLFLIVLWLCESLIILTNLCWIWLM